MKFERPIFVEKSKIFFFKEFVEKVKCLHLETYPKGYDGGDIQAREEDLGGYVSTKTDDCHI